MKITLVAVPLMALCLTACQSLTKNCPEDPAEQSSLLCASAGHYSGANKERVDSKREASQQVQSENQSLTQARDADLVSLTRAEARRDELRQDLIHEQSKLSDISAKLEQAKNEKNKSADELASLEAGIESANEKLQYLQVAPVENTSDYEENLKLKQDLEEELDDLLEALSD